MLGATRNVRRQREVAGPHRFLSSASPGRVYVCAALNSALVVSLEESSINKTPEMPSSRHHVDRTASGTHEPRQQQQLLRRSAGAPALLLPLLLLADKPERTLGWMHIPGNPTGVQIGRAPSTAPAPSVPSLGMLQRAVRRRKHSSSPPAGTAAGADLKGALLEAEGALAVQARGAAHRRAPSPGSMETGRRAPTARSGGSSSRATGRAEGSRDRVKQQMKQLGRQGMWKEALEQLEREGSDGVHPVRARCVCT